MVVLLHIPKALEVIAPFGSLLYYWLIANGIDDILYIDMVDGDLAIYCKPNYNTGLIKEFINLLPLGVGFKVIVRNSCELLV